MITASYRVLQKTGVRDALFCMARDDLPHFRYKAICSQLLPIHELQRACEDGQEGNCFFQVKGWDLPLFEYLILIICISCPHLSKSQNSHEVHHFYQWCIHRTALVLHSLVSHSLWLWLQNLCRGDLILRPCCTPTSVLRERNKYLLLLIITPSHTHPRHCIAVHLIEIRI